jgi:transposase
MRGDRDLIPKGLKAERLSIERGSAIIHAASVGPSAGCPVCGRPSRCVHSSYERAVADLPWHGAAVTLRIRARRFFCDRASCPRRIFCERLWARCVL